MKQKLIVVDFLAEIGHVKMLQNYISILSEKYDIWFISSVKYCELINTSNYHTISNKYFDWKSKFEFVKNQVQIIKKVKGFIKVTDLVFITSFENISFSIFWKHEKTFALIHNNLNKNRVSDFFFKRIKTAISFFVFEDYIKEYLVNIVSNKTYTLPHTLNCISENNFKGKSNIVFVPSATGISSSFFETVIAFVKKNNLVLYYKDKSEISSDYVVTKNYFLDYYELLKKSEFIILDCPFDYRVSGTFYEAMNFNKKIVILEKEGIFMKEMKNQYPNSIKNFTDEKIKWKKTEVDFSRFILKHSSASILNAFIESQNES
ncbi:hypothetical protein NBT05_05195 [Aquimarina sp. ERC-38]|uniref:hypothetical protein n=1 Tax=Aquimarina sp. ERC-38 TaxID=2949996 RepID=UPI00224872CA|nr:hypothetical protein [Aquimarina sp. ERC-38]UZO81861.1 hypothetical protein NBT05_05195 [Aquimarina sp. ERC-38]